MRTTQGGAVLVQQITLGNGTKCALLPKNMKLSEKRFKPQALISDLEPSVIWCMIS